METLAMLDLPMETLAILVLGTSEPEVTMARGMLMLTHRFWLPPMLVLDSAMDILTLPLLEPAEIISELLSHAKFE